MMCLSGSRLENPSAPNTPVSPEPSTAALLVREIERLSTRVHSTERPLFRQGEKPCALYLIKTGEVMYSVDWAEETKLCYAVGPDSLAGLSAVFAERPYAFTATASRNAEIRRIEAGAFLDLIHGRTDWYLCALRLVAEEALKAEQALIERLALSNGFCP